MENRTVVVDFDDEYLFVKGKVELGEELYKQFLILEKNGKKKYKIIKSYSFLQVNGSDIVSKYHTAKIIKSLLGKNKYCNSFIVLPEGYFLNKKKQKEEHMASILKGFLTEFEKNN
ncbi:MAG: hypothetical protein ACRCX2_01795 [Paraclostridium sp.]